MNLFGITTNVNKTKDSIVTRTLNENLLKNTQDCSTSVNTTQSIKIGDLSACGNVTISGLNQTVNSSTDVGCIAKQSFTDNFKAEFQDQIKSTIENNPSTTTGFSILNMGTNITDQVTENITDISNKLDIDQLQTCYNDIMTDQEVLISNINTECAKDGGGGGDINISNIRQLAIGTAVNKCLADQQAAKDADLILSRTVDKDIVNNDTALLQMIISICSCICILIIVSGVVALMSKKGKVMLSRF